MSNLHVNLAFSADTGKAKAQIQELQTLLSKIAYSGSTGGKTMVDGLERDLTEASAAAKELQFHLNNAFNTTTGKFDLSLLDRSLKTSNSSIQKLSAGLLSAGTDGQQAFLKLAQSISLADQPMLRISKRMQDFAVTMRNTVKWQLSSSMLHGFMGAVQSAYGYAQDLNKSLNNIRIVTGYSTDKMAEFAEQANKAAKSLSTTTTDYTDASLIYFQQGLKEEEVQARTDITIKMANAVGQSAEVVSEQLTAVWNNFADGSQSLEYYVDVMTALGAATASSSDEISQGLSKFAAVAGTVGLSYEYATAALTTLTSNTRESADVVGNALKTLFARIQGLQLGETLEDGTTLNKYSQALEKVGISIYDASGGLKDMDNILDEMAAKWSTLSDTQQVALAQTVAGVRQYNQLIALMENWNKGDSDSMLANLKTIENSQGALQKQADIYAESWEAAEKRVKAAAEGIFQSLLDDDFFISLTNGFANVLNGIDAFIDGAGGIKTILIGIASVVTSTFAHKIPQALDTLKYNLTFITKGSQAAYDRIQDDMNKATQQAYKKYHSSAGKQGIQEDSATGFAIEQANKLTNARNQLSAVTDKMNAAERQMANTELSLIEATQQEIIALKQKNEELQKSISLQKDMLRKNQSTALQSSMDADFKSSDSTYGDARKKYNSLLLEYTDQFNQLDQKIDGITSKDLEKIGVFDDLKNQYQALIEENDIFNIHYQSMIKEIQSSTQTAGQNILEGWLNPERAREQIINFKDNTYQAISSIQSLMERTDIDEQLSFDAALQEIKALSGAIPSAIQEVTGLDKVFSKIINNSANLKELKSNFKSLEPALRKCKIEVKDFEKFLKKLHGKSIEKLAMDVKTLTANEEKAAEQARNLQKLYANFNPRHIIRISEAFGSLASMLGNVSMLMNSISSLSNALSPDVDMTVWERVSAVIMGLSMAIPSAITLFKSFGTVVTWVKTVNTANTAAIHAETIAQNTNTLAKKLAATSSGMLAQRLTQEQLTKVANIIATEKEAGSSGKVAVAKVAEYLTSNNIAKGKAAELIARLAVKLGTDLETASVWSLIGALLTETVVIAGLTMPIWALIAAFAALAAIITLVVKAAIDSYNADALAAEKANKQVELLTEKYQTLIDEVEKFKEAASNYDDAIKALEGLDTKTKEYTDALQKANDEARNLIETYGLYDDFTYENGLIKIDEKALEQVQKDREMAMRQAQNELNATRIGSNQLNTNSEATNLIRKENLPLSRDSLLGLAKSMNEISEANGNVQLSVEELRTALSNNVDILQKNGITFTYFNNIITNDTIDALYNFADSLVDVSEANLYYAGQILNNRRAEYYGEVTSEAATTESGEIDYGKQLLFNQAIDTIVSNKSESEGNRLRSDEQEAAVQTELYTDFVSQTTGWDAGDAYETLAESTVFKYLGKDLTSIYGQIFKGSSYDGNINTQEMLEAYFKDQGYKNISVSDKIDGTNDVTYTDLNGNVITANYTNDAAQEMWGQHIADYVLDTTYKSQLEEHFSTTDAEALLNDIKSAESQYGVSGTEWGNIILDSIANNQGETLDFSSIFSKLNPDEIEGLKGLSNEEKLALFGLTPEDWKELGLTSVENFGNAFNSALDSYDFNSFAEAINTEYEALAESYDIDVDEFKTYRDMLAETNSELAKNPKLLNLVALAQKRYEKGSKKIVEIQEEYNDLLKRGAKELKETGKLSTQTMGQLSKILPDLKTAVSDLLDLDADSMKALSPTFLIENWEDIIEAINGSEEAYLRVQQAASKEILFDVGLKEGDALFTDFMTLADSLQSVADMSPVELEAHLNSDQFLDACTQLVNQAGMTQAQAQAYFDDLGYDAKVEVVDDPPVTTKTAMQVPIFKMTPDGGVSVEMKSAIASSTQESQHLRITSINKKDTGGGGYAPPPSSSGGGGGGSKKHAEQKDTSDRTRYHTLNNQLEDLSDEYDKIAEAADRAFGDEKLKAIDKEIKATDDLIHKQEEYLEAISENLPIDKDTMITEYNDLIKGPKMEFDEYGNITNYDDIEKAMHDKYNSMAKKYTEDSTKWQEFEKEYEWLEELIQQYEDTQDLLREEKAAYQDYLNQKIDLQLEKVQYKTELKLNVSEDDMSMLEYQFDLLEDKAFSSVKRIEESVNQAENIYDQMRFNQEGLEDVLALSNSSISDILEGDFSGLNLTEAQVESIKEYRDNLLDLNAQLNDIQKQIEEEVLESFNEFHDEIDKGMEKFDHYNSMLESYRNIVDIVGKDVLNLGNEQIAKISAAQVDNAINQLGSAKETYDSYRTAADEAKKHMDEYEAKYESVKNTSNDLLKKSYQEDYEFWKASYEEMDSAAREAQEDLMDKWGNTLEAIVSQFEMSLEAAVESFNDTIYSLGGLEGLQEDFSRQKENADMMLDDYQKIYELSKLSRDINKTIDDTDALGGKQKLKKLLGEINELQEDGVEMSQYDLEYLQKTYDLRLAELELEEAQRAKNTVRLSKDNEGNWSYIYTQNTDAVDAAQQKYEDALYAMQDLSSNYIDEMSEQLISTSQEMAEALAAIRVQDYANINDYYAEVERVQAQYQKELAAQEVELQKAINNNKDLYETDWTNYHNTTNYKISDTKLFATTFKDTLLGTLMESESDSANFTDIVGASVEALTNNLWEGAKVYYDNVSSAMDAADTKTGEFATMLEQNISSIKAESEKAADAITKMATKMDKDFNDVIKKVAQWQGAYSIEIDKIITKNESLITSFNNMIRALSGEMSEIDISYNINPKENKNAVEIPEGIVSGDTGLYTGDWNSKEGRLAILHQKELLLNENDTSNFLTAIKITRAMLETIDLNAKQASFGLGSLIPSTIKDDNTQTLEQQVHIVAEFPNVNDHNEIEQAFSNLINTASQYANRK